MTDTTLTNNSMWPGQETSPNHETPAVQISHQPIDRDQSDFVKFLVARSTFDTEMRVDVRDFKPRMLARLSFPPERAEQAYDFVEMLDSIVQSMPTTRPTPMVTVRLIVSASPITPSALPQSNEEMAIGTIDASKAYLNQALVGAGDTPPQLQELSVASGVMFLVQGIDPLFNTKSDVRASNWDSPGDFYATRERDKTAVANVPVEPDSLGAKSDFSIGMSQGIPGDDGLGTNEMKSNGSLASNDELQGMRVERGRTNAAADVNAMRYADPYSNTPDEQGEEFIVHGEDPITPVARSPISPLAAAAGGVAAYEGYELLRGRQESQVKFSEQQQENRVRAGEAQQRAAEELEQKTKLASPHPAGSQPEAEAEAKSEAPADGIQKDSAAEAKAPQTINELAFAAAGAEAEVTASGAPEPAGLVEPQRPSSAPVPTSESITEALQSVAENNSQPAASQSPAAPAAVTNSAAVQRNEAAPQANAAEATSTPTAAPQRPTASAAATNSAAAATPVQESSPTVTAGARTETNANSAAPNVESAPSSPRAEGSTATVSTSPAAQNSSEPAAISAASPKSEGSSSVTSGEPSQPAQSPSPSASTARAAESSTARVEAAAVRSPSNGGSEASVAPATADFSSGSSSSSGPSAAPAASERVVSAGAAAERAAPKHFEESSGAQADDNAKSAVTSIDALHKGFERAEDEAPEPKDAPSKPEGKSDDLSEPIGFAETSSGNAQPTPVRDGPTRYDDLSAQTPRSDEAVTSAAAAGVTSSGADALSSNRVSDQPAQSNRETMARNEELIVDPPHPEARTAATQGSVAPQTEGVRDGPTRYETLEAQTPRADVRSETTEPEVRQAAADITASENNTAPRASGDQSNPSSAQRAADDRGPSQDTKFSDDSKPAREDNRSDRVHENDFRRDRELDHAARERVNDNQPRPVEDQPPKSDPGDQLAEAEHHFHVESDHVDPVAFAAFGTVDGAAPANDKVRPPDARERLDSRSANNHEASGSANVDATAHGGTLAYIAGLFGGGKNRQRNNGASPVPSASEHDEMQRRLAEAKADVRQSGSQPANNSHLDQTPPPDMPAPEAPEPT